MIPPALQRYSHNRKSLFRYPHDEVQVILIEFITLNTTRTKECAQQLKTTINEDVFMDPIIKKETNKAFWFFHTEIKGYTQHLTNH